MNENYNEQNNENIDTGDTVVKKRSFISWLDNFWYHYKWHSLIALFLIFTVTICTLQMCQKESYDMHVLYAGDKAIDRTRDGDISDYEKISQYLTRNATDRDDDGKTKLVLKDLYILSQDDIKKNDSDNDGRNDDISDADINRTYNDGQSLKSIMMSGNYYVCLFSPEVYNSYKDMEKLVKLDTEFLGTALPEQSYCDGTQYGIRLSATEFAKKYPILSILPDDTVLCLRAETFGQRNAKAYNAGVDYLKRMVLG